MSAGIFGWRWSLLVCSLLRSLKFQFQQELDTRQVSAPGVTELIWSSGWEGTQWHTRLLWGRAQTAGPALTFGPDFLLLFHKAPFSPSFSPITAQIPAFMTLPKRLLKPPAPISTWMSLQSPGHLSLVMSAQGSHFTMPSVMQMTLLKRSKLEGGKY